MLLDELVARLTQLPEKSRTEAIDLALKSTATMAWVPNPGPQAQAFLCEADELFYGGEAGGGKTDLGIGLALTAHKRSLLLRRQRRLRERQASLQNRLRSLSRRRSNGGDRPP